MIVNGNEEEVAKTLLERLRDFVIGIAVAFIVAFIILAVASCGPSTTSVYGGWELSVREDPISSCSTATLTQRTAQIQALRSMEDWAVDSVSLATVSQRGLVTAVSNGRAGTVEVSAWTATGPRLRKQVLIQVSNEGCSTIDPPPSTGFSLRYTPAGGTAVVLSTQVLTPECFDNALAITCPSLRWTSNPPNIVRVLGTQTCFTASAPDPYFGVGCFPGGSIVVRMVGVSEVCLYALIYPTNQFCRSWTGTASGLSASMFGSDEEMLSEWTWNAEDP